MSAPIRDRLEQLLAAGKDSALLRFSLGNECLKTGDTEAACRHLESALEQDAAYSAAWKLLGRAHAEAGRSDAALKAFERGIAVAEGKGDKQAAREMQVFARRLLRQNPPTDG